MDNAQQGAIEHEVACEVVDNRHEPRWPAFMAIVTVPLLFFALPRHLRYTAEWVPLSLTALLVIPLLINHRMRRHDAVHRLGLAISGIQTLFLMSAVVLMVANITNKNQTALDFLQAAGVLFPTNILVFALWYWRLDAGGPHMRDIAGCHVQGEFLFPQMTMDWETRKMTGQASWTPGFVDYLFLAFNTSTALSPADTAALSRLSKVLMMIQASISLTVIVLLAARAVNML